jgi:hypothetical protein
MSMTSKERARTALLGGVPDQVPFGPNGIDYDIVERILGHETYVRARGKCLLACWEGRRDEMVQSLVEDTIALFDKLDICDIIRADGAGPVPPKGYQPEAPRRVDAVTWEFADGRVFKYSELTGEITMVYDPQEWTRNLREDDYPLEFEYEEPDPSVYELIDAVIDAFGDSRFLLGAFPLANEWVQPGGMARSLLEMAERPALVDRALQSTLAEAKVRQAHWTNRGIDGVIAGTDWAFRSGTFMSPEMWRRFCYPALEANVKAAHDAGLIYVKHACGNNWAILEDMMMAGVDGYQSIQASASMDLAQVREATRGRMALWGGVLLEHLVAGTPDEVRQDVRTAMEVAKEGGGFILGPSHSIAVGTQYDNFMAMLDEFDKLRAY